MKFSNKEVTVTRSDAGFCVRDEIRDHAYGFQSDDLDSAIERVREILGGNQEAPKAENNQPLDLELLKTAWNIGGAAEAISVFAIISGGYDTGEGRALYVVVDKLRTIARRLGAKAEGK